MAAPTGTALSKNTLTLTTVENYLPKMADNITDGPGLMRYSKRHGLIKSEKLVGSEEIMTIDRETNTNGQWFDDADVLTTKPSSGLVDARIGHYNYTSSFHISDTEKLENVDPAKIRSRLEVRMNTLKRAFTIDLSQLLAGTRNSNTSKPEGIRDVCGGIALAAAGTTGQGTLHGIASGTYTWWRAQTNVKTTLGANNSNMRAQNIRLFLELQKKQASPKVGICDMEYYENYTKQVGGGSETSGYNVSRMANFKGDRPTGKLDVAGPPELAYGGVPIIYDPYVAVPSTNFTSGTDMHCNWIDTDFLHIVVDPRWNFKLLKPRPRTGNDDQLVDIYRILFRCTMRCYKREAQAIGVINLT